MNCPKCEKATTRLIAPQEDKEGPCTPDGVYFNYLSCVSCGAEFSQEYVKAQQVVLLNEER